MTNTNPNPPNHPEIYRSQADQYEALVSREDYQCRLLPALQEICPLEGKSVVELGAGTGRLTCLLAPKVKFIHAFDRSAHMLEVAAAKLKVKGAANWKVEVSYHRSVNAASGSSDLIVSGWSICYIVVDHPDTWRIEMKKVMDEMTRILKPGGSIILIETMGTGFTTPTPPDHLKTYYQYLQENGFDQKWVRTDYRFENQEIAEDLSGFFFGEEMNQKIEKQNDVCFLPECTGLFWINPKES